MKKVDMLIEKMSKSVVNFKYQKKDGSIREAKGTTNPLLFTSNYIAKGGYGPSEYGFVSYWDVNANGWRCFDPDKFIEAEGIC